MPNITALDGGDDRCGVMLFALRNCGCAENRNDAIGLAVALKRL